MKYKIHVIIGWCAGIVIGMAIDMSQNNIALSIGSGAAFGTSLGYF